MTLRIPQIQAALRLIQRLEVLDKTAKGLDEDDGKGATEAGGAGGIIVEGCFPSDWRLNVVPRHRVAAIREICREEIARQRAEILSELKSLGIEP